MVLIGLWAGCGPTETSPTGETGTPGPSATTSITMIAFNVESGESDIDIVAQEVVADMKDEAVWAFSEVPDQNAAETLVAAAVDAGSDQPFDFVFGTTGVSDRLALAWNEDVLSLEDHEELDEINVGGSARAPLVGRFRVLESGTELLVVANHLWRTDEAARHEQGTLLNEWGRDQDLPVVLLGDFNFDWEVDTGRHDAGYDNLVDGGVFEWVRPDPLLPTQCSFYESVLDFVFVGGAARTWEAESDILRPDDSYCSRSNEDTYSDHRPVRGRFEVPAP